MRDLKHSSWKDFCQRLTRQQQGGTLTIEQVEPDGRMVQKTTDAVFDGMALETGDACNNVLSVRARAGREITCEIIDPIYILLRESNEGGDYNPVEIQGENGTTRLTFQPAIHAELLEGLEFIERIKN